MSYRVIQNILDDILATVPGIPTIVNENENYGGCNGYYIRTSLMPAQTDTASLGPTGSDRFYGLYQIDLVYPINEGTDAANHMSDLIIAAFPKGVSTTQEGVTMRIVNYWRDRAPSTDQKFIVPVVIEWETYLFR